jgi:hypothetical protein
MSIETLKTTLGNKKYLEDIIVDILATNTMYTDETQARTILARMNRSYSHVIIDGTDYILVPSAQKNPAPVTPIRKVA